MGGCWNQSRGRSGGSAVQCFGWGLSSEGVLVPPSDCEEQDQRSGLTERWVGVLVYPKSV